MWQQPIHHGTYRSTGELCGFNDAMTPESGVKDWAFFLIGAYCVRDENDRTLSGIERFFSLDTPYNQATVRDNEARQKTAVVYRFISAGKDLLLNEMIERGLLRLHASPYIAAL